MDRKKWKTRIKAATKKAGTYQPFFDAVIDTLAGILENRDKTEEIFAREGGEPVVEHTNKNGSTNMEQNPMIRLINDLNRDALAYWRELGLTPAGLKRLNDTALKEEKGSSLEEAIRKLKGSA